jgi:hypothetical protein
VIVTGHAGNLKTGLHTRTTGTLGHLYVTLTDEAVGARLGSFPTFERKLAGVV